MLGILTKPVVHLCFTDSQSGQYEDPSALSVGAYRIDIKVMNSCELDLDVAIEFTVDGSRPQSDGFRLPRFSSISRPLVPVWTATQGRSRFTLVVAWRGLVEPFSREIRIAA